MSADLLYVLLLVECRVPLAVTRWADGPRNILREDAIAQEDSQAWKVDGWWFEGGPSLLKEDYLKTLRVNDSHFLFGVSCVQADEDWVSER